MIRGNLEPFTRRLRRNKCLWPNPEASVGLFYRKMGRESCCWEATGPARDTFIRIADQIKDHLEKASEPVPQVVTWTMYMIGRTKETAEPMVLFCCTDIACRKQVRRTIEESGILQKYPGVRVGDASQPPDFDQLIELAGDTDGSFHSNRVAKRERLRFYCEPSGKTFANMEPFGNTPKCVIGEQISVTIPRSSGWNKNTYKATIGGIVMSGSRAFFLTAGHVFEPRYAGTIGYLAGGYEEDFVFDIGEEDNYESEEEFIESTSRGSATPESADCASSDGATLSVGNLSNPTTIALGKTVSKNPSKDINGDSGPGFQISSLKTSEESTAKALLVGHQVDSTDMSVDYALIELVNHPYEWHENLIHPSLIQRPVAFSANLFASFRYRDARVVAFTSSGGCIPGMLSGTPTFTTTPRSNKLQELWTVRLEGKLEEGDCGSWVVSLDDAWLYGHIVAGSPESGVAYIIPIHRIFSDAHERFGFNLKLASVIARDTNKSEPIPPQTSTNFSGPNKTPHPKEHDPKIWKSDQSGVRKTIPQGQRLNSSALYSRTSQGHKIGSASPSSTQRSKQTSTSSLTLETPNIKLELPREYSRLPPQDRHPLRRYDHSPRENKKSEGPWTSSRSESEKNSLSRPSMPRDHQSIAQSDSRSTKSETLKSPVESLLKRPPPPASQYPPPKIKVENSLIYRKSDERKLQSSNIEEENVCTWEEFDTLAIGTLSLRTRLEKLKIEETEISRPKKGALNVQTKTDELEKRILELKRSMNTMVEELEAMHQRVKEKEKLRPDFQPSQQAGKITGFRPSNRS